MSRLLKEDFKELCNFIKDYGLSGILANKDAKACLSSYHKKYFAYLIIVEVLHHALGDRNLQNKPTKQQYEYLQESCSDVGQAFFLLFHGCYKGAKLLLRSSIENFLKSVSMDEDSSIITTKSVYEVFDKAKAISVFNGSKRQLHSLLHNEYALLCQDVHTANQKHMASISAMSHFPSFLPNEAKEVTKNVQCLIPIYVTLLALKYNQIYHSMEFMHKEICNALIIDEYKK